MSVKLNFTVAGDLYYYPRLKNCIPAVRTLFFDIVDVKYAFYAMFRGHKMQVYIYRITKASDILKINFSLFSIFT